MWVELACQLQRMEAISLDVKNCNLHKYDKQLYTKLKTVSTKQNNKKWHLIAQLVKKLPAAAFTRSFDWTTSYVSYIHHTDYFHFVFVFSEVWTEFLCVNYEFSAR